MLPSRGTAIPAPASPTATDNCDDAVDIDLNEVRSGDDCTGTITRTWTATDDCGNTDVQTQVLQPEA